MKKISLLATMLAFCTIGYTQNFQWAKRIGGSSTEDATSIVKDASGNIYTVGNFQGTVDFDPGAGTFNLSGVGNDNLFIQKLDATGNFIWAKQINSGPTYGVDYIRVFSVTVDAIGNIYFCGWFRNTVDFDPGAGTYNLTSYSTSASDAYIEKLDASGNFVWVKHMGGVSANVDARSIAIDPSGNIYTTGYFFWGVADFDPGAGVFNLAGGGSGSVFIQKLNSSGNFLWALQMCGTGTSDAEGYSVALDASGNVYTTGLFSGTVDFDPGVSISNLTSIGSSDIFISKLNTSGGFQWVKQIGSTGSNAGKGIKVDGSGNIYVTGTFSGTADFDPGAGTSNLTSTGGIDLFTLKLNASGNFAWAKKIGGTADETPGGIAIDATGNVYTVGTFQLTADFDPGASTFNLSAVGAPGASGPNGFIQKLDASGNFVWAVENRGTSYSAFGAHSYNFANAIALDATNSAYVAGSFIGEADFDPGPDSFKLIAVGWPSGFYYYSDFFVQKISSAISPITGSSYVCLGLTTNLTDVTPGGAWSSSNTTIATVGSATGIVSGISIGSAIISYTAGTSYATKIVSVTALSTAITGASSLCIGGTITLSNATLGGSWSSGSPGIASVGSGTGVVTGMSTGVSLITYTVLGCRMTKTVTVSTGTLPIVSPITGLSTVNVGATITLTDVTPGGTWSASNANATVSSGGAVTGVAVGTVTISYSVTNSCGTAIAWKIVTVNPTTGPTITITSSVIPSWQRENDDFGYSIRVSTTPTGSPWFIRAYVFNADSSPDTTIEFPPVIASSDSQNTFWALPVQNVLLKNHCKNGRYIMYQAVPIGGSPVYTIGQTRIIEKKWNNKNVAFYNHSGESLQVPMKYIPGAITAKVSFARVATPPASTSCDFLQHLPYGSGWPSVPTSNKYYSIALDGTNNLSTIEPGLFKCTINYFDAVGFLLTSESGLMDLTKYGKVNDILGGSTIDDNKIVVLIGGINNDIESDIYRLATLTGDQTGESWSIVNDLVFDHHSPSGKNYNTWYIATGNLNSIQKNAYDIGLCLDAILNRVSYTASKPLNIIAHSRGGLETRILLDKHGIPNNGNENNILLAPQPENYDPVNISAKLSSVTFLGSPHRGAFSAYGEDVYEWLSMGCGSASALGAKDLVPDSKVIEYLTSHNTNIQPTTNICNITGYTPFVSNGDNLVTISSSENPNILGHTDGANQFQYYVSNNALSVPFHSYLHRSTVLDNSLNTCSSNLITKITKIINGALPELSCTNPLIIHFIGRTHASILPNAIIAIYDTSSHTYRQIAKTDENGIADILFYNLIPIGDTISISAPGIENVKFVIDTSMAQNRSFMIPMFHRTGSISLSQTSVSLVNQNPVTEIPSAQVSVTALNSNIIEYNFPLHSDTTYHGPIPLTSSYTIPSLDSGKNIIQFRFIGNSFHDTIYLRKVIYFLPGVLKNIYTDNQIIWGDSTSLGSKILVDGNFYKTNSSVIDSVRLIKGAHYIEFKKYGYHEGLYSRDSVFPLTGVHLDTITYSSLADSAFFDFTVGDKNNFWKTISVLDSAQQSKISVRQFNKNLSILGLITKSRLYDFRHLNTTWSNVRFASELDQKENLSVNSVYLLKISDGVRYEKIAFDTISHRAEYDSAVQKLSYNFINFDSGTAATEALVIIKKQAPVLRSVSTINIAENGALVVPLSLFFSDPDSISNDMTYSFVSTSPAGLSLSISNDSVVIRANHCYSGSTSFTINATHDWLIKSNSINVHVSSNAGIITGTSSLCVGSTTVLSNAKTGGMWSSNDTSVVDIDNSGVIVARAKGTAIISYKKTSGGCTDIATKTVTVNGIAGPITGPTAVCLTHTIQLYDTEPGGAWGSDDFTIILPSSSGQMIATGPGIANITHTVTNSCGISSASHAITVYPEENCITNVSGTANLNLPELKIFPNPNTGTFTVTLISNRLEQMDIKITNLLGQKVKEFTSVTNQATFIKLNEVSGIYFLSARTPSGSYSAKMTIE